MQVHWFTNFPCLILPQIRSSSSKGKHKNNIKVMTFLGITKITRYFSFSFALSLTYTHTHIHTYIHTYIHIYTHTAPNPFMWVTHSASPPDISTQKSSLWALQIEYFHSLSSAPLPCNSATPLSILMDRTFPKSPTSASSISLTSIDELHSEWHHSQMNLATLIGLLNQSITVFFLPTPTETRITACSPLELVTERLHCNTTQPNNPPSPS